MFLYVGHRTVLGAHIGAHFNGELMCFPYSLSAEDCCTERTGERVAGTYSVCHFHPGRFLI